MDLIHSWRQRSRSEKWIDAIGLAMQSLFVPVVASYLGLQFLPLFVEIDKNTWSLPFWVQFLLPFTLIDYLYYWNHRLMHRAEFWWLHRVHHTARRLDIFVTSRNSLWTVFFFVYMWAHSLVIFSQVDPSGFVFGMYLLACLDLWRHSGLKTRGCFRSLGLIFILPEDHSWHHSSDRNGINFGANLNLWDRMHGTYYRDWSLPKQVGEENQQSVWINFLCPWRMKK